ncbi:hypothetical protein BN938_2046 [Mucinivorans hirudinis]|uniref:DUF4837 domain-containing protein n=1 Tax=Mucinivorans hirudinis TaxID=1433126 RepID=A0A060RDU2_9BACT|nr:hypothetical protein BN938_2046 [Mucinivorans hirudinis]
MKKLLFFLFAILVMTSCESSGGGIRSLPPATGTPYSLLVVSSKAVWDSSVGDTVKSIFAQDVEMLNIPEPLYSIINVAPSQVTSVLDRYRNIFYLIVNKEKYDRTHINVEFDKKAEEQTIITIYSPSIDSMTNYIGTNGDVLLALLDKSERDRYITRAKKYSSESLKKQIYEKFGFLIDIPSNYKIRNEKDDFIWISYDPSSLSNIGFTIYTFESGDGLDVVRPLVARNEAVMNIPGGNEGSYMTTEMEIEPTYKRVIINGQPWIEMRGFWKMHKDFLGGPFVNFTTQDPATGKMVGIDCYVMSQSYKDGMRNYIRQLEAMVLTLKFKE